MRRASLLFRTAAFPYPGTDTFRAAVNYITDGDTVWVERDTGCRDTDLIELRLTGPEWRGVNTPETNRTAEREAGLRAKTRVEALLPLGVVVMIRTKPDTEKFGRWLSPVTFMRDGVATDLATLLVDEGLAVWKDYL